MSQQGQLQANSKVKAKPIVEGMPCFRVAQYLTQKRAFEKIVAQGNTRVHSGGSYRQTAKQYIAISARIALSR